MKRNGKNDAVKEIVIFFCFFHALSMTIDSHPYYMRKLLSSVKKRVKPETRSIMAHDEDQHNSVNERERTERKAIRETWYGFC